MFDYNKGKSMENNDYKSRDFGEINLIEFRKLILRNKKNIALFIGGSIFFSFLFSFSVKPKWEGQFEIVISQKSSKNNMGSFTLLDLENMPKALTGSMNTKLKTEVEILRSPSILLPVFNFVKSNKSKKIKNINEWNYTDWLKENLDIKLKAGTSVLKINYRDTDKNLIIPVLSKISSEYQKYSGRDKKEEIQKGINYLENQIKIYKFKSNDSYNKHKEFALKNNLESMDSIPNALVGEIGNRDQIDSSNETVASISNLITNLEMQLSLIEKTKDDDLIAISQQIIPLEYNDLSIKLSEDNKNLVRLRKIYKPKDIAIRKLENDIQTGNLILRKTLINFIISQKEDLYQKAKVLEKPREILVKHKVLTRNAIRDEEILVTLEDQLNMLNLENARQSDKWDLITRPTLYDEPVNNITFRYIALGALLGSLIGITASYFKENFSNKIYNVETIYKILEAPLLAQASFDSKISWGKIVELLTVLVSYKKDKNKLAILPIGNFSDGMVSEFIRLLNSDLLENELMIAKNVLDVKECTNFVFLVALSITQKEDLYEIKKKLKITGNNLNGFILLE